MILLVKVLEGFGIQKMCVCLVLYPCCLTGFICHCRQHEEQKYNPSFLMSSKAYVSLSHDGLGHTARNLFGIFLAIVDVSPVRWLPRGFSLNGFGQQLAAGSSPLVGVSEQISSSTRGSTLGACHCDSSQVVILSPLHVWHTRDPEFCRGRCTSYAGCGGFFKCCFLSNPSG